MFEQKVHETAYFRREMAAMGIDRVDRQLACPELCQDRNKTPRFEIICYQKSRCVHQALAVERSESQRIAAVSL
jgi:hypothetical protein